LLGLLKRLLNIYVFCILQIEICSPINGDVRFSVPNVSDAGLQPEDDAVVGLHLFARQKLELSSRYCKIVAFWVLIPYSRFSTVAVCVCSYNF
jgi:hypothetical protein